MAFSVVGIPFSPSNNTPLPLWPDDDPDNPTAAESDGMIAAFAAFFSDIPDAVPVNVCDVQTIRCLGVPLALGTDLCHEGCHLFRHRFVIHLGMCESPHRAVTGSTCNNLTDS